MVYEFRPCELEMDYDTYVKFLLRHHDELNLPYPFSMRLSFISSPLILGKAMLIIHEETGQFVGAAGFAVGTGANDYEDRHVCQVEIAFIQQAYRHTLLFLRGLQALLELMQTVNPEVEQVQFWTAAEDEKLHRLFSKFDALPGASRTVTNRMALHAIPYSALAAYCQQLSHTR